jgi:uncharacterized Ntn-hydrolase superfamily protein
VGAVATQSIVEPAYGPRGLALMNDGKSAPAALHQLLADDPQEAARQVAMIDRGGRVAVHTGSRCIKHAGHAVGDQVSAQANMMERDTVPAAMVRAYSTASGVAFAERLLAALDAAQAEGGDLRGRQSAALLVVRGTPATDEDDGVLMDLRVDDSGDPVAQLRMLRNLQRAYDERDYETLALFAPEGARDLYAALAASRRGDRDAARTALEAMRSRPGWSAWLAAMSGDSRLSAVSQLLG